MSSIFEKFWKLLGRLFQLHASITESEFLESQPEQSRLFYKQQKNPGEKRPSFAELPPDIEEIPEYQRVISLINSGTPVIFVTGGAGTGKSTLIQFLRFRLPMSIAIAAPTGVAALNAGGVTLHSFFRLPPRVVLPEDVQLVRNKIYRKLDLLIVDEVSMVRPDMLDGVDRFLQLNRRSELPFGGVQVLLIGDMAQLPPVVKKDEWELLSRMNYRSEYFLSAKCIQNSAMETVLLKKVFRQTDESFIDILNRIRLGKGIEESLNIINRDALQRTKAENTVVLACTNNIVEAINEEHLGRLPSPPAFYHGNYTGEFRFEENRLPSPMLLTIKAGARVMFTKNDMRGRWVNGTVGEVAAIHDGYVEVQLIDDRLHTCHDVQPVSWEQYHYKYDAIQDKVIPVVSGTYTQLPLMLAWAVTINKAQGKTLPAIHLELGDGAFAHGQLYSALSRVRQITDISLARKIEPTDVITDPRISDYYRRLEEE